MKKKTNIILPEQIKDAHSPMCPDKVPQKPIYYKKRFIFDFLKSV